LFCKICLLLYIGTIEQYVWICIRITIAHGRQRRIFNGVFPVCDICIFLKVNFNFILLCRYAPVPAQTQKSLIAESEKQKVADEKAAAASGGAKKKARK
jgi:hypothetical protein